MSRAVLVIATEELRAKAAYWLSRAKLGSRVEFKGPQRTHDQNARMWAMLTDVAEQQEVAGAKRHTETWKALFIEQLGHETEYLPSLDGERVVAIAYSSSDLSTEEMSDLIELMFAWGFEHGVVWSDPKTKQLMDMRRK